ncbi:Hypothetical Protein FCC1311_043872 [Hondaea fermentalgiana]|uniref:Uncharacterized protein n=1 Tax=Hondaea fermentalgiana TaxID=2315210 RepID=A0A2R5GJX5_9STRA|nr:Hypothetical Protein FCC1311_043872 [Hondaea fermentalgiana]|eukprot:GBG28164.1 Hypothetical Protein FCC1311_043872 [Hondaea fermentalgiana]
MLAEGESYRDRGSSDNVRLIVSDGNGDAEDDKLKRKVFSPRGLRRFSLQALRLHAERVGPAKLLACGASVVCVILVFLMWLYPEYIGSDIPTLVFGGRTCMVLDSFNIEVAGNANRMDSLIIAAELSRSKGYDYLAVDDVWQAWMCKVYSDESIDNLKAIIPVIPLSKPYTSENCVAFARMYQSGQVKKLEDTCETGWSHSSFYRYPWHHKAPGELFPFGDWRYLAPTGKGALDATLARLETIRSAHRGKKIVAVHRRWLSRSCVKPIQLSELDKYDEYEKYCHLTPDMVRSYLSQSGISEDEAHVIVSTDGLVPEEDALFSMWQIESEDIPFMQQVWLWVYADVFIGNPKSTIDQAACRWRTLYCKDCLPCLPQDLFVRAHTGFKQGSVPVHVP